MIVGGIEDPTNLRFLSGAGHTDHGCIGEFRLRNAGKRRRIPEIRAVQRKTQGTGRPPDQGAQGTVTQGNCLIPTGDGVFEMQVAIRFRHRGTSQKKPGAAAKNCRRAQRKC